MATDRDDDQEVELEEEVDTPDTTQDNVLDMSDEEFMAKGGATAAPAPVVTDVAKEDGDDKQDDAEAAAAKADEQGKAAKQADAGEEGEGEQEKKDQDEEEEDETNPASKSKEADKVGEKSTKDGKESKDTKDTKAGEQDPAGKAKVDDAKDDKAKDVKADAAVIDYKAQYEELLKPFKANGRDIQVNDVEEARRLMQMGANYNKKMAGLKPSLAVLKMLENNGLNDPAKLSFLIDLDKKNPEAISKLIAESGLDPLDLSTEKAGAYKPGDHRVADAEVELDTVLEDLSGSPHYTQLLDLVGKEWDPKSRGIVAANPGVLRLIDAQMNSGIYDLVATEMARQRALGSLPGLSDLEAYRQVGDAMNSEGKFDHLFKKAGQPENKGQQAPAAKIIVDPNPKKADDDKREQARRAAAPSRGTAPAARKIDPDFNPLALSDEDFAKFKPNFK